MLLPKVTAALLTSSCLLSHAAVCAQSPEEAVRKFVEIGVQDGRHLGGFVRPKSLAAVRAKLEQLLDDRYAPDSAAFREELVGKQWSAGAMRNFSDEEFVGRYVEAAQRRRPSARVSDIQVVRRETTKYSGEEVTVSYELYGEGVTGRQTRKYSVYLEDGCWKLDAPVEMWARLEFIAKTLKESREPPKSKEGPSRAKLQIGRASEVPRAGTVEVQRRNNTDTPAKIWVDTEAVLTEADIAAASASWDCEAGFGPEDVALQLTFTEEGTQRIRQWSQRNFGSMLAVVVNEQASAYAKVAGVLGSRFSICLRGASLEEGQLLAADLRGAK